MMPDQDSFWDELLAYIEAHSVIPIVGPELVIVDHDGRLEPYHRLLARELAARLKVGDLGEAATLNEVVGGYLAKPGSRRQSVYRELGDIAAKLTVKIPEPLLQLASIRDLNLFASFCTDNLLAQAINAARFGGRAETRELAFNPSEAGDLPDGPRDVPVVYGLFGRMSVLPKYVIAEEDELEWVTALQIPEKRPERLFDELGHNHLLFLGCGFPDWLARFILRTAKNSKLSAERGFSEYLIDVEAESNSPLVAFLTSFSRETVVLSLDPVDFVAELSRRWQERQGGDAAAKEPEPGPMPETMPPGSLFISYASEDRPAALRLAAELQDAGLPVWLDRQQLDWGSDYTARIRLAIQQCALFVPVLSRTAEQRTGFFRKEWAWASERNLDFTGSSLAFLCPLVIDDTPVVTSNEIPPAFKMVHIEQAPAGQPAEPPGGSDCEGFQRHARAHARQAMNELPTIDAERPWPGLLPFGEDSRMYFHGREAETDELFRLIEREPLTVLFGQSGLGKSSLLNAGVFPNLRRAGYLPVYLRLNLDDTAPALIDQVWHALICECVDHEVNASAILPGDGFWQYLHRPETQFLNPHGRPVVPVLAFDQFEEIFTLGRQTPEQTARTQLLLQQLGELIENRLPPALERELTVHPELLDQFDLLRQNIKMVFTFREDYLAEFESLKTVIRPIMQNRMRLTPMRGDRAATAIETAGGGLLSASVAARIVRFVGGAARGDVRTTGRDFSRARASVAGLPRAE